MTLDFAYQIGIALLSGGAVYGGIRADLRAMHERIKQAQDTAERANARLDNHIDKGK